MPRHMSGFMLFFVNLPNFLAKGAPSTRYFTSDPRQKANVLHRKLVNRLNSSFFQRGKVISGINAFVETPRNSFGKVHSSKTRLSQSMNEPNWNPNNFPYSTFTTDSSPAQSEDDDVSKWESMYYAPLQQQSQVQTSLVTSNEPPAPSKPTASDIRIITFDLDNTLWKTGPTISKANAVLNSHLQHAHGVRSECLVEAEMGRLFELHKRRYAGGNFVDEDIESITTTNGVNVKNNEEYISVMKVGETQVSLSSENDEDDDGIIGGNVPKDDLIHIRSASKKKKIQPVHLTMLRKDAIRSLIEHNSTTMTTMDVESLEGIVETAFQLWMDARTESITQNYATNVLPTLSELRSSIIPATHYGKLYIGAITDGNSDPMRVPHLSNYFDFVIRAEDVGVSKPDVRVYKAAVAEVIGLLTRDGVSVENFFLGENSDSLGVIDTTANASYMKAPASSYTGSWKDVDEEAVEAFSEAVGPWWVHVGDDFFKDVVASKVFQMRSVWVRELIAKKQTCIEEEKKRDTQTERTVEDLEKEISKQNGVLRMSIGESEFLKTTLHEEFSDAILDRFDELSDLLIGWHQDALREQRCAKVEEDFYELSTASAIHTIMPQWENSAERDYQASRELSTPTIADATDLSKNMKFCVFCGEKLPRMAKFCSGCGEKQP